MTNDEVDGDEPAAITVRTFVYTISRPNFRPRTISYDIQIPNSGQLGSAALDYFGHLVALTQLPLPFHEEVKAEFLKFVSREEHKFGAEWANRRIERAISASQEDGDESPKLWGRVMMANIPELDNSGRMANEDEPPFEEQFQQLMRHGTAAQLSKLVRAEGRMADEMRSLVRARDFEVDRITRACEASLEASSPGSATNSFNTKGADKLEKHSYELSILNEKLRQVSINYSNQIEALCERQRQDYWELVRKLWANEEKIEENEGEGGAKNGGGHDGGTPRKHLSSSTSVSAFDQLRPSRVFKKSISYDSRMSHSLTALANQQQQQSKYRSESFTIYIGAQLKSMHNARILLCERLSDLTISHGSPPPRALGNADSVLHDSRRLHLLMSLYRRDLSAVVLIVGRDPLWHVHARTLFAQLCEQSPELHFDSLESQLRKLEDEVRQANHERRVRRQDPSASPLAYDPLDDSAGYDENTLRPGDVYITCHSNLSAVQVVFHLVGDRTLAAEEISSRHPCIGGLRNIIRLSPRSAVHHITLPLLLVEEMSETMTMSWCLGRAELVYKCLKGFLMEVCSSSNSSTNASASSGSAPHFNINFALPASISGSLFAQLTELFSSIFHLVPSKCMSKEGIDGDLL